MSRVVCALAAPLRPPICISLRVPLAPQSNVVQSGARRRYQRRRRYVQDVLQRGSGQTHERRPRLAVGGHGGAARAAAWGRVNSAAHVVLTCARTAAIPRRARRQRALNEYFGLLDARRRHCDRAEGSAGLQTADIVSASLAPNCGTLDQCAPGQG